MRRVGVSVGAADVDGIIVDRSIDRGVGSIVDTTMGVDPMDTTMGVDPR